MSVLRESLALPFVMSTTGCLVLGPWVIRRLQAHRWYQPLRHDDCPPLQTLQRAKQGTPTMGGLLVVGVAAAVAIGFGGLSQPEGWWVLGAALMLGAVGLVDDLLKLRRPNAKGLRCWPKLLAALAVGSGVGAMSSGPELGYQRVAVPWLSVQLELGWWWIPLAAVVVAGAAHAVNLTDGMDGLASGCLALAFGALGLSAALERGNGLVAVWCAALAGSCVGFLWFNSVPASVFLGDIGALSLGAALGVLALLAHAALGLVIVGGIFVAEALSVMLQVGSYRWRNRRRIFRVAPLHHHFQLSGVAEPKLVVRFWIIGLMLAALGFSALSHS